MKENLHMHKIQYIDYFKNRIEYKEQRRVHKIKIQRNTL